MTDAVYSPLLGAAQIQFVGAQATTTDTAHVPPGFEKLPTGTLLQGFVVNRDAHNNPILRTSMGDVLVRTDVFLKTGSDVVMRVINNAQQSSARIVSVDGTSIQQLQQQQDLQQVQAKQDLVLQSSMANGKAAAITAGNNSTPAAYLQGVLLDATSNAAKPHVMAAILNIPTEAAKAISEGAPVEFRVIASNLNITETTTPKTPVTVAEQLTSPAQQATFYQAYSKISNHTTAMPPLFRPTVESAHPAGIANLSPSPQPTTSLPPAAVMPPAAVIPLVTPSPVNAALLNAALPLTPQNMFTTEVTTPPAPPIDVTTIPTPVTVVDRAAPAVTNTPALFVTPSSSPAVELKAPPALAPALNPAAPEVMRTPADSPLPTNLPIDPATTASASKLVSPQLLAEPELTQTARAIAQENINALTPIHQRPESLQVAAAVSETPKIMHVQTLRTGLINATVIGSEANGGTILRTPIGTIKLFTDNPPPVNSILQLEVATNPTTIQSLPSAPAGSITASIPSTSSLLTDWPSIGALQALAQTNPDLAIELATRIPNTKSKLVNSALFFIAALRAGSLDQWLGRKAASDIERLAPGISKQLHSDLAVLQSIAQTDPEQPWQIIPFPLQHEQDVHQLRLYVRQDNQKSSNKTDTKGTRFVLDLTLSQLGDIQLDGFSRHLGNQLMFDLIFRSVVALPEAMQQDLSALFAEAAAAAHFTGSITFQNNPDLFVHPLDDILSTHPSGEESSILA